MLEIFESTRDGTLARWRGRHVAVEPVVTKCALVPVATAGRRVVDHRLRRPICFPVPYVVSWRRKPRQVFVARCWPNEAIPLPGDDTRGRRRRTHPSRQTFQELDES